MRITATFDDIMSARIEELAEYWGISQAAALRKICGMGSWVYEQLQKDTTILIERPGEKAIECSFV